MTCARHVQATMKVKAQKVIYRIKHAALVQCFEMWADNVANRVCGAGKSKAILPENDVVLVASVRRTSHLYSLCFEMLSIVHNPYCMQILKDITHIQIQAEMKVRLQKIVYRVIHAALVQCFEMWTDNVREQVSFPGPTCANT